ncbi:uncharacterized protein JN550_002074 [Neoarthrinium moseri]|uniref:uncharacterized protein n=1 Tax=Neoarthrinium moseri TaxID=1658444 RepID=UPI001FDBD0FE|nr:uncharacterized protein JN550_002074 [Neoarthrinium moseri]KAI1875788.1 hypothetical protein JN550_002074 [Neoarthrinium moseri]
MKHTSVKAATWHTGSQIENDAANPLEQSITRVSDADIASPEVVNGNTFTASLVAGFMPHYSYHPLPDGSIRLLRLLPDRDKDAPLRCNIVSYPLLESGSGDHSYDALSYVWGTTSKDFVIFIEDFQLAITRNLATALLNLRDPFIERFIWVDAICIHQDDVKERNHQVQSMAMIYAQAARVLVWLGEQQNDSEIALQAIHQAADEQFGDIGPTFQDAIRMLLKRPWFKRIWVLQEVAAAQNVLVMCGSSTIDGAAFCSGLNALGRHIEALSDIVSLVRPASYLIRHTVFKPKVLSRESDTFSLRIRPLGELIDMYHTHEASDRRDKVYALLGMASVHSSSDRLSPDYEIEWGVLFRRLVQLLLSKNADITTWNNKDIAVIRAQGFVVGKVLAAVSEKNRVDRQIVDVSAKFSSGSSDKTPRLHASWVVQSLAIPIRKNDLICVIRGASRPIIIRTYQDYCAVISVALTPLSTFTDHTDSSYQDLVEAKGLPKRDFLLVWDWNSSRTSLGEEDEFHTLAKRQLGKRARGHKATRRENVRLLWEDAGAFKEQPKEGQDTESELRGQLNVYVEKFRQVCLVYDS